MNLYLSKYNRCKYRDSHVNKQVLSQQQYIRYNKKKQQINLPLSTASDGSTLTSTCVSPIYNIYNYNEAKFHYPDQDFAIGRAAIQFRFTSTLYYHTDI